MPVMTGRIHSVRCVDECLQAIEVRGIWDAIPDKAPASR
jgi:hypothetical protein